jgi:hypothetical protein
MFSVAIVPNTIILPVHTPPTPVADTVTATSAVV